MARRKDHSQEEMRELILAAATRIVQTSGAQALTARDLAKAIGYVPGTIYNFYRDMAALLTDVNYQTLGDLHAACVGAMAGRTDGFEKINSLAYAYVDFARKNTRSWETLFAQKRKGAGNSRLPVAYRERLLGLFQLIEDTLHQCLKMTGVDARRVSRILWACLHGIAVLTVDGRLKMVGVESSKKMIDDILQSYLADYLQDIL